MTRNKQVIFVVENNQDRASLEDTTAGRKYAGTLIPAGTILNIGDDMLIINEEGVVFVDDVNCLVAVKLKDSGIEILQYL